MASFYITFREIAEFSFILLLLSGIYKDHKKTLIAVTVPVIAAGFLITAINYPLSTSLEHMYFRAMLSSFVFILYLSLIADRKVFYPVICIVMALLFPSAQLAAVLIGKAELLGGVVYVYASAGLLAGSMFFVVSQRYLPVLDLKRFFRADGIMVFIASFCFLFGGPGEFESMSIITSLQQGLHSLFASPRLAMAVTALLLFIPPIYVFIRLLFTPEPVADGIALKAEKRKVMAGYIGELIKKGTPLILSFIVSIVMLHSANLAMNPLFDPEPVPLIVDGPEIKIPLKDSIGNISDGRIRKYSFRYKGTVYRMLVIMRPDGEVVAALDACEICPPTGYVQRGEHVICKYCSTPLPLQSLGQHGGCNPIPLRSEIVEDALVLNKDEVIVTHDRWIGSGVKHSGH